MALSSTELLELLDGCDLAEDANAVPALTDEDERISKPVHKRRTRCTWRLQRRDELKNLQIKEKQLLLQLQSLRISMRSKCKETPNGSLNWEQICARQEKRRRKSEEDNRELKDELQWRKWQAKALLQGFKRRMRNEVVGASIALRRRYEVDTKGVSPPTNNEAVFRAMLGGMDEMYADVDTFFKKMQMQELPCPGRRSITLSNKADGKVVEVLDNHAVPFELHKTERAVWKCFRMEEPQSPKPAFVQNFDQGENTVQQSMCTSFSAGSVRVRVMMRKVGRKHVEQGRAVFVFRRLIEPLDVDVKIAFQETTRLIVRPGPASESGPTSLIQSHRQGTANMPMGVAYDIGVKWVPRAFIDMGVAAWESSITQFNHFVEDTLLRESS